MQDKFEFPVIDNKVDGIVGVFHQRLSDGYVNATELCKSCNKEFSGWKRLVQTDAFLQELASVLQIQQDELIHSIVGGNARLQGTYVHPQVAVNLAQWLSPKFAVAVSRWVTDWMRGDIKPANLPYHLRRYMSNQHNIPPTHFSMLNEMTLSLIAPMEKEGYTMPNSMVIDASEGRMFCGWLRKEKNLEPKDFDKYPHRFEDGRVVQANLYQNNIYADFKKHLHEVWIPKQSAKYFAERDPKALPYLEKVVHLLGNRSFNVNKSSEYIDNIEEFTQNLLKVERKKPKDK